MGKTSKAWLSGMRQFLRCQQGAVAVMGVLIFPISLILVAGAIDISRVYIAHERLQLAADAAILATVSSASVADQENIPMSTYASHVLWANTRTNFNDPHADFTRPFMGGLVYGANVTRTNVPGEYILSTSGEIPLIFGGITGEFLGTEAQYVTGGVRIFVQSRAMRGFGVVNRNVEVVVAIDSTIASSPQVKAGLKTLVDTLFPTTSSGRSAYVTLVPYGWGVSPSDGVSHTHRLDWIDPAQRALAGYVGLRPGPYVYTDDPPFTDAQRFQGIMGNLASSMTAGLPTMILFGATDKATLTTYIDKYYGIGAPLPAFVSSSPQTGVTWAWMALSNRWVGLWDFAKPSLPLDPNQSTKWIIMLVGDKPSGNDAASVCLEAIKKNINIMVLSYGDKNKVDYAVRNACPSRPSYYIHASESSTAEIEKAFAVMGDTVLSQTVRISK